VVAVCVDRARSAGSDGRERIDRAVCFPFTLPSAFDPYAFKRSELKLLDGRFPFDVENQLLADEIERIDPGNGCFNSRCSIRPMRRTAGEGDRKANRRSRIENADNRTAISDPSSAGQRTRPDVLAEQHDLSVLFHTATNPNDKWAQVSDCLDVAEAFPKVRFNLAHSLRFHAPLLMRAKQLPNVWIDCSAHLNHCKLASENSIVIPPAGTRVGRITLIPSRRCLRFTTSLANGICGDRTIPS